MFGLFKKKKPNPPERRGVGDPTYIHSSASHFDSYMAKVKNGKYKLKFKCPVCPNPFDITYTSIDFKESEMDLYDNMYEVGRHECEFCKVEFVVCADETGRAIVFDYKFHKAELAYVKKSNGLIDKIKKYEDKAFAAEEELSEFEESGIEDEKKRAKLEANFDKFEDIYTTADDALMTCNDKWYDREDRQEAKISKYHQKWAKR